MHIQRKRNSLKCDNNEVYKLRLAKNYRHDFANLFIVLHDGAVAGPYVSLEAAQKAGAVTMNIGMFLNATISFIIVAFAVFILIKAINTLQEKMLAAEKKEEAAAAPTTKKCPFCCTEIPLDACRCPNCTSELDGKKHK